MTKFSEENFSQMTAEFSRRISQIQGPAVVGVPKSLLLIFVFKYTLCANFLVTNNQTPDLRCSMRIIFHSKLRVSFPRIQCNPEVEYLFSHAADLQDSI